VKKWKSVTVQKTWRACQESFRRCKTQRKIRIVDPQFSRAKHGNHLIGIASLHLTLIVVCRIRDRREDRCARCICTSGRSFFLISTVSTSTSSLTRNRVAPTSLEDRNDKRPRV
jgi:hypothetical protein